MKIISKETQSQNFHASAQQTQKNQPEAPKQQPQALKQQTQALKQTQPTKQTQSPKQTQSTPPAKMQAAPSHPKPVQTSKNNRQPEPKKDVVRERRDHIAKEKALRESGQSYLSVQYNKFISLIRFNITFKLTLGYAIRLIVLIALLFATVYLSFSYYLFYSKQQTLKDDLAYIEDLILSAQSFEDESIALYLENHEMDLYVFDSTNQKIYSSDSSELTYTEATEIVEYNIRDFPNYPDLTKSKTVTLDDQSTYTIALHVILNYETQSIEATFPIGIVLCIVLLLTSVLSASKMAKKHMSPILNMTEQVKDMSANNLSTRLNISGTKDELKDLAATFNKMLDDIQKSYEREKQFVSDASHELRTPIAVIKGYAGMLNRWGKDDSAILEESIQAILGETDNMHSLVESLLFIARNDKGTLKMDKCDFMLSDLFTEIVKETHLIDTQHKITDHVEPAISLFGSADKLKQAIRIFIDNSIKYTPDNGAISLSLRHSEQHAMIVIKDNGIGISKEDLPHIFDRFYRADKSRTKSKDNQHGGTGLGLSIAKIIIEQHGGTIHVDSELNEGTTFTLFLPLSTPSN